MLMMEPINESNGLIKLQLDELSLMTGGDVIQTGCALYGGLFVVTGGVVAANPIGSGIGLFCAGYALGSLIGRWLS